MLGDGALLGVLGGAFGILGVSWKALGVVLAGLLGRHAHQAEKCKKCAKSTPNKSEIHRRTGDVGDVFSTFVGPRISTIRPPWLGETEKKYKSVRFCYLGDLLESSWGGFGGTLEENKNQEKKVQKVCEIHPQQIADSQAHWRRRRRFFKICWA